MIRSNKSRIKFAFITILSICLLPSTHGAPINYGDFSDIPPGSVMYLDVTETANSPGDEEPLHGPPNVTGNSLDFDPPEEFRAAGQSAGPDLTDGQLNFTIMGTNAAITNLDLSAAGIYSLSGSGTEETEVGYQSGITQINIIEVDGAPVSSPVVLPGSAATGSFNLSDGTASDAAWASTLAYDVSSALSSSGVTFQFGATKLDVTVNNLLNATNESTSESRIEVDSIAFGATTVPVPEPTTSVVFAIAALCSFAMSRRRRF